MTKETDERVRKLSENIPWNKGKHHSEKTKIKLKENHWSKRGGCEREIFTKHLIDFQKTGVPKCVKCEKPFVHAYDSIMKKKSKYLWRAVVFDTGQSDFVDRVINTVKIIIEYKSMAQVNMAFAQSLGIRITGMSKYTPIIYADATPEQIARLQADTNVKRVSYDAPVKMLW